MMSKLFMTTTDKEVLDIIDVSKWNGTIDWDKVKATGNIDGVFARSVSSLKGQKYIDESWERNYSECKRLGIPIGTYFISYATTYEQLDGELDLCLEALNGKQLDLPLAMDIETANNATVEKATLTDWLIKCAHKIEQRGFYPILYSGLYFSRDHIDMELIRNNGIDVWLADYRGDEPEDEHTIWQYTSAGFIDGIDHNVDMNECYIDYPALIKRDRLIKACKNFWTGLFSARG